MFNRKRIFKFQQNEVQQSKFLLSRRTPLKTKMEPENGPLEKEIPFGNHPFQVPC